MILSHDLKQNSREASQFNHQPSVVDQSMLSFLVWSLFIAFSSATIHQSSDIGENATVSYDMIVAGGESECSSLLALGNITLVNTVLVFLPESTLYSDARDMFFTIRNSGTGDIGPSCVQYGGWNYNEPGCVSGGVWPASWDSGDASTYLATADLTSFGMYGSDWEVCVGNGYIDARETGAPSYQGSLSFTSSLVTSGLPPSMSPTSIPSPQPSVSFQPSGVPTFIPSAQPIRSHRPSYEPSNAPSSVPSVSFMPTANPFDVTSDCDEIMHVDFALELAGSQKSCVSFPASERLEMVQVSLQFSGATGDEEASDMLLIIINASRTGGIQIGGFNSYAEGIDFAGRWPVTWQDSDSGLYTATVNVSQFNIEGAGYYEMCIGNGYLYADSVQYSGTVDLPLLKYRCDISPPTPVPSSIPTVSPTQAPTAFPTTAPTSSSPTNAPTTTYADLSSNSTVGHVSTVYFDAHLSGNQYLCLEVYSSGALSNVSLLSYFSSSNPAAQASDLEVTVTAPTADRCIVVGGHVTSLVCPAPVASYEWSSSLDSSQSGDYAADVLVESSSLLGDGAWQVMCSRHH
jgi:hypothetical protein